MCHWLKSALTDCACQWTRKVGGRTRTRWLTQEELDRYRPWFDSARRLRELIADLETLCLRTASEAEAWPEEW